LLSRLSHLGSAPVEESSSSALKSELGIGSNDSKTEDKKKAAEGFHLESGNQNQTKNFRDWNKK
jgi:hypothetical protein